MDEKGFTSSPQGEGIYTSFPWSEDNIDPVLLAKLLTKKFDTGWVVWEPETLRTMLENNYKTTVSNTTWQKILALRVILRVDSFWRDWGAFEKICCAFNDVSPDFNTIQYLSIGQICYTLNCLSIIRTKEFSPEVTAYIVAKLKDEGMVLAPKELNFSQELLNTQTKDMDEIREKIKLEDLKVKDSNRVSYFQKMLLLAINEFIVQKESTRQKQLKRVGL